VIFAISRLERIQDNRLLVVVRVIATSKAARSGTFLGTGPDFLLVQARMTLEEPLQCKAISLVSSADEQTEQKYHFCEAVASPGKKYFPSELANGLLPGQAETLRSSSPFLPYRPPNKETLQSKRFLFFPMPRDPLQMWPSPEQ
jgi:hypothetical protein